MSPLSNLRSRLKAAFQEHSAEWRPGGMEQAAPSDREADAAFVADPGPAAASAPRPPPRHATAAWPPPTPPAPRDEASEGSRASLLARLRSPAALREAFVIKEILDRPVGLRLPRGRGLRG